MYCFKKWAEYIEGLRFVHAFFRSSSLNYSSITLKFGSVIMQLLLALVWQIAYNIPHLQDAFDKGVF